MKNSEVINRQVRVMQIIQLALIMGVVAFGAFVIFAARQEADGESPIPWLMAGFGGLMLFLRFVVPPFTARAVLSLIAAATLQSKDAEIPLPESDEGKLAVVYQMKMIAGSALLEGGAIANLAACMMTGHLINWVMTGILLLGLIISFPMRLSVERWIESKLVWMKDERSLARRD